MDGKKSKKTEEEHENSETGGWYSAEITTKQEPAELINLLESLEDDEIEAVELEYEDMWDQYRFWVDFHWFNLDKIREILETHPAVDSFRFVDDNNYDLNN